MNCTELCHSTCKIHILLTIIEIIIIAFGRFEPYLQRLRPISWWDLFRDYFRVLRFFRWSSKVCVSPQNAAIPFLPTAIIVQSVGRALDRGSSLYPMSNLYPCFKNKEIYYCKKTRWLNVSSYRGACARARAHAIGPTFVTLSEYGIFYGTMVRKRMWVTWMQRLACSARCRVNNRCERSLEDEQIIP